MNFKQYQEKASTTAIYPKPYSEYSFIVEENLNVIDDMSSIIPIMYCALGLTGEAGEVAEQVKKSWRNDMRVTDSRRENIRGELGDVLWYTAQLATELDLNLEEIAKENLNKLLSRKGSGKLKHE